MPINLAAIKSELLPGLLQVEGKYEAIPSKYKSIFSTKKSTKAFERTSMMRFLPYAQIKTDGGATTFDNESGERYVYNQTNIGIGLGFAITRNTIDDNQYKSDFGPSAMGLNRSFSETKETFAAAILNNATTYDSATGGDGVALCSTSHPIDGGTIANRPAVDVDLNESSLLDGMIAINANWKDQAGLRINANAKKLIVPPQLEPTAIRLTKTALRPGTANNDVNAIMFTTGGIPDGYVAWNYLTSQYAWYLLTNCEGLLHLDRIRYEMSMQTDFNTDNLLVKGFERYSFGHFDWRAIYGSFPTS